MSRMAQDPAVNAAARSISIPCRRDNDVQVALVQTTAA